MRPERQDSKRKYGLTEKQLLCGSIKHKTAVYIPELRMVVFTNKKDLSLVKEKYIELSKKLVT